MNINRKNFTLIELLLVVAVIVILVGIFLPIASKIRARSIKTSCLGNLRRIGLALDMYTENNNGYYPCCARYPSEPAAEEEGLPSIAIILKGLIKDSKVFLCPGEPREKCFRSEGSSYEWNSTFYNGWKTGNKEVSVSRFKNPVMWDYGYNHGSEDDRAARNYLFPNAYVAGERSQKVK